MNEQQVQIFTSPDGQVELAVSLDTDTVWLSQRQMAELFDKDVRTVNEHIKNIYREHELSEEPTIRKFRIVRQEGQRQVNRELDHYNLDVVISVGYRVKSKRGALPLVKSTYFASVTEPEKVAEILRTLGGYEGTLPVRCALRLGPLVFVRPRELRHAEWEHID